ncbi:MAG: hypothetical protein GF315_02785 [candidate division Zixibacteria bacterium]|nr:hypothetical protein [candidate division Zixibacteria bacterium]
MPITFDSASAFADTSDRNRYQDLWFLFGYRHGNQYFPLYYGWEDWIDLADTILVNVYDSCNAHPGCGGYYLAHEWDRNTNFDIDPSEKMEWASDYLETTLGDAETSHEIRVVHAGRAEHALMRSSCGARPALKVES